MDNLDKLEELAKPLIEYLKANYNPHTTVCVSMDEIKILQVIKGIPLKVTE